MLAMTAKQEKWWTRFKQLMKEMPNGMELRASPQRMTVATNGKDADAVDLMYLRIAQIHTVSAEMLSPLMQVNNQ